MSANSTCELIEPQNSAPDASAEEVSKKYIKHEACVKSIGTLYCIGAGLLLAAGITGPFANQKDPIGARILVSVIFIGLGIFQLWVSKGLWALKSWVRIPVGVLSGLGLLAFPLGTIINGYILYLVFCEKGTKVFSPEYQQVVAATPQIKYKTSIIVWIVLGILITIIVLGLFAALFSK